MTAEPLADIPEAPHPPAFTIEYAPEALEEIRSRGESIGVLYGERGGGRIRVLASAEVERDRSSETASGLAESDRAAFSALTGPRDGMEAVGWYCVRTGAGLELTPQEHNLFNHFFPREGEIALVIQPSLTGTMESASYVRGTVGATGRPARKRSRAWLWAAAAAMAALVFLAVQIHPGRLGLRIYGVAPGQLRIEWDRGSGAVQWASSGTLEISDGASQFSFPLSPDRLRSGSVTYQRHTADVFVKLHVDPQNVEEAMRFSGEPVAVAGPPVEAAAPVVPVVERTETGSRPEMRPAAALLLPRTEPAQPQGDADRTTVPLRRLEPIPWPSRPAGEPLSLPTPPPVVSSSVLTTPRLPSLGPVAPQPYSGPRNGRLIWTGELIRRGVVEIDGAHASVGSLVGGLPGVPVSLHVSPAEFAPEGLVVYTSDSTKNGRSEPAERANGWNATRFTLSPVRAHQIAVL
jgi:hypothetical protein